MTGLQDKYGTSKDAVALMAGEFATAHPVSPALASWFSHMAQTDPEKNSPHIVGMMDKSQFQASFRQANEKTSSSPAGLHYTIWKAMAALDSCAECLCVMISLPFMYGFVNNRWTKVIDVMLEKKKGVRQIHMLRIIGLLEADFNTALKYFFAVQMQDSLEKNGSLAKDQWGCRRHVQCIDAYMTKLCTHEASRSKRQGMAEGIHDCRACYDRMAPATSNLFGLKQNVAASVLVSRAKTIEASHRSVKISTGVSKKTYCQIKGDHPIDGEVQGKGDTPTLFGAQSSVSLNVHEECAPGVKINNPTGSRSIQHNNVSYVDDNDSHVSAALDSEDQVEELVTKLQLSSNLWNEIVQLGGHALAFHKEHWSMLAYEFIRGEVKLVHATDETILLEDGKGAFSVIDFRPPNQPNGGLGVKFRPDGKQFHQLEDLRQKLATLCGAIASAHLTEKETFQALMQRLIPKLSYPMHGTSFTQAEVNPLNSMIRRTFFPSMRINRNFPSAVAYGPLEYGGMDLPELYTLQDTLQIPYLLKTLRWNNSLANDFIVTLDNKQIESGFVSPILDETALPIEYIDSGWISGLRNRLRSFSAGIWVEDAWQPKLQREHDRSLMEEFSQLHGITKHQLRKVNGVRLYLRVITIADLANEAGDYICDDMLTGEWTAGTDLEFPKQDRPPPEWFALFRKCIRNAFSTTTPANQRSYMSLKLDQPLGDWYEVKRNTWWSAYKGKDAIYYRGITMDVLQCFRSDELGFYSYDGDVSEVPLDTSPISVALVDDRLWTHRRKRTAPSTTQQNVLPGHIVQDTLPRAPLHNVTVGCDGSVHLKDQVAAAAWLIKGDGYAHASACIILSNINAVSSYRSELEGIYRGLLDLEQRDVKAPEVTQWCDNELAVTRSNEPPSKPRHTVEADADLVLAIQLTKSRLPFLVHTRHVYGHQDGQGKRKADRAAKRARDERLRNAQEWTAASDSEDSADEMVNAEKKLFNPAPMPSEEKDIGTSNTTDEVQINIECDRIASETTQAVLKGGVSPPDPVISLPYAGSKAMFRIRGRWITSKVKTEIKRARRSPAIKVYMMEKYGWDNATFESIHWPSVLSVRSNMKQTQRMQSSKLMHGWLPVMHMRQFITGINYCPGCPCTDETLTHVFQCPNPSIRAACRKALAQMKKVGKKKKIPSRIMDAICHFLQVESNGDNKFHQTTHHCTVTTAIDQQLRIGSHMLPRGFLAKAWYTAIAETGCQSPDIKMNALQRIIWDCWSNPIWKTRNEVLHGPNSRYGYALEQSLSAKLLWFQQNKEQVLARSDQFLANIDVSRIDKLNRSTKQRWIKNLEKARKAFEVENKQRRNGQAPITDWLVTLNDRIT